MAVKNMVNENYEPNGTEDKVLEFIKDEPCGRVTNRYVREHEIVAAAYAAVPTYASEASWRSNLWNSVGTALRKTGAVELTNKSRGRWRWVGE